MAAAAANVQVLYPLSRPTGVSFEITKNQHNGRCQVQHSVRRSCVTLVGNPEKLHPGQRWLRTRRSLSWQWTGCFRRPTFHAG